MCAHTWYNVWNLGRIEPSIERQEETVVRASERASERASACVPVWMDESIWEGFFFFFIFCGVVVPYFLCVLFACYISPIHYISIWRTYFTVNNFPLPFRLVHRFPFQIWFNFLWSWFFLIFFSSLHRFCSKFSLNTINMYTYAFSVSNFLFICVNSKLYNFIFFVLFCFALF